MIKFIKFQDVFSILGSTITLPDNTSVYLKNPFVIYMVTSEKC